MAELEPKNQQKTLIFGILKDAIFRHEGGKILG